jgi:hypothetical protein
MDEMWVARNFHSQHDVLLRLFYTHHQPDSEVMRNFVKLAEAQRSRRPLQVCKSKTAHHRS